MRRAILPLIAALMMLSVLPARADEAQYGLTMTVYNDFTDYTAQPWLTAPEQEPCFIGIVPNIDYDWGGGPAAETCNADYFLVHFSGWITVPTSGAYEFLALVDDGWHMTINDQLINDNWVLKGCGGWWSGSNEGYAQLDAGVSYPLDAWMYEWGGGACAILWYGGNNNYGVVPAEWLTTQPLPTPEPSMIPPSIEPSIEPTPTPTEEPSPSQEPSYEPSPTPTPTPEPTPSPTPKPTPRPTPTPSPSASLDPSPLPTDTPTVEPSPTPEVIIDNPVEAVAGVVGAIGDETIGRIARLGQDLKPEDKKKAQPVAVAVIVSQVASAAVAAAIGKVKK